MTAYRQQGEARTLNFDEYKVKYREVARKPVSEKALQQQRKQLQYERQKRTLRLADEKFQEENKYLKNRFQQNKVETKKKK